MKEFADRPLRVSAENGFLHAWRMLRWVFELRLVPRLTERRGGWLTPLRALRDGLTAGGWVLLTACGLLLLLARPSNPGFDLGLATAGLLLIAASAAVGQLWRPRLRVQRLESETAIAGRPCRSRVRISNTGRRPARELVLREFRGPGWRPGTASQSAVVERVDPGASRLCELIVRPTARGLVHLPGLAIHSYFPLFVTRSTLRVPVALELAVLPPPLSVNLPPLRQLASRCLKHGSHAARAAGALEYAHSRPYQAGDPATRLDQRASARRGELMSRVFRDGAELSAGAVAIYCDTAVAGFKPWQRRPQNAKALDRRLALVLELAARARREALPVQAVAFTDLWQPLADDAALQRAIAACPPTRHTLLPATVPRPDWLYLLVTEDWSEALAAQVSAWRGAGHVVLVFRLTGNGGSPLPVAPGNLEITA